MLTTNILETGKLYLLYDIYIYIYIYMAKQGNQYYSFDLYIGNVITVDIIYLKKNICIEMQGKNQPWNDM